jgi:hypothetical protein
MDTATDTVLLHFLAMEVNLTKRIDTPEGRRYCPAILAANGRIKPSWVLVNGKSTPQQWRPSSVSRIGPAAHRQWVGDFSASIMGIFASAVTNRKYWVSI